MNSASPGVIALFQPNRHYPDHESYLYALADAMRPEYEAIVAAGFLLQLDSPDLGLGRHMMFKGQPDEEYRRQAELHVEALNHALRNVPADRVRLHVCWGNYEGPHIHDAHGDGPAYRAEGQTAGAVVRVIQSPSRARVDRFCRCATARRQGPGSRGARFHHQLRRASAAGGRTHLPLRRYRRTRAGDRRTDCGFSTFAGFGAVDPDITYAKLAAMAEGAAIASRRLW